MAILSIRTVMIGSVAEGPCGLYTSVSSSHRVLIMTRLCLLTVIWVRVKRRTLPHVTLVIVSSISPYHLKATCYPLVFRDNFTRPVYLTRLISLMVNVLSVVLVSLLKMRVRVEEFPYKTRRKPMYKLNLLLNRYSTAITIRKRPSVTLLSDLPVLIVT